MKTLNLILGTIIILQSIISCNKEDDNDSINCDQKVIISADDYNTEPDHQLNINNLELSEDCLKINFSSGGCNGDTWEFKLIDSEVILYSDPPQRNLRLSLKNEELCEAYITKEITFDINDLQVDGNKILLNIINSDDQIFYEY